MDDLALGVNEQTLAAAVVPIYRQIWEDIQAGRVDDQGLLLMCSELYMAGVARGTEAVMGKLEAWGLLD